MITIDNYNLYYNTEHLLLPNPKTYMEVLDRLDSIECKLLYNIISSPTCRYETGFSEGRINEHYRQMDAESRFKNIFIEKVLYANPKSYFVNKLNIQARDCEEIKSVSFTLSDYKDLPRHFAARGSDYGICFFHDFLQNNGLRPVVYLNDKEEEDKKQLVFNSPHLLEVYSEIYDMRWENEWRISHNLTFSEEDIAFVIVPPDKHSYFVDWFCKNDDFSEIQVISSNTFRSYVDHLILFPQQIDNNWDGIEIHRNQYGKGFKVYPDYFNGLTNEEKTMFGRKYHRELNCLTKNTILSNYEYAYTNRFLRFRRKIRDQNTIDSLFPDYAQILSNFDEPYDTQRNLIIALYEGLIYEFGL